MNFMSLFKMEVFTLQTTSQFDYNLVVSLKSDVFKLILAMQ